ncbi:MAG: hypothetical protein IPK19_40130 [Chloroflexi bacterium]|nr:hypothetical protein [Chloroflexota bacterium]
MKMLRLALVLLIGLLASGVLAQDGAATLPPPADGSTPVATEEAAAEPDSALGLEQSAALPILLAARSDLEILATQAIGTSQRPLGWNGSIDTEDPDLPLKIRLIWNCWPAPSWPMSGQRAGSAWWRRCRSASPATSATIWNCWPTAS